MVDPEGGGSRTPPPLPQIYLNQNKISVFDAQNLLGWCLKLRHHPSKSWTANTDKLTLHIDTEIFIFKSYPPPPLFNFWCDTMIQCWFNVGTKTAMPSQHWTSNGWRSHFYSQLLCSFRRIHILVYLSYRERGIMAKFRCRNQNLPIESGCRRGIPRNLRICELCTQDIGDEFHYIFNCPHFEVLRKKLIKKRHRNSPSSVRFETLMNETNIN